MYTLSLVCVLSMDWCVEVDGWMHACRLQVASHLPTQPYMIAFCTLLRYKSHSSLVSRQSIGDRIAVVKISSIVCKKIDFFAILFQRTFFCDNFVCDSFFFKNFREILRKKSNTLEKRKFRVLCEQTLKVLSVEESRFRQFL